MVEHPGRGLTPATLVPPSARERAGSGISRASTASPTPSTGTEVESLMQDPSPATTTNEGGGPGLGAITTPAVVPAAIDSASELTATSEMGLDALPGGVIANGNSTQVSPDTALEATSPAAMKALPGPAAVLATTAAPGSANTAPSTRSVTNGSTAGNTAGSTGGGTAGSTVKVWMDDGTCMQPKGPVAATVRELHGQLTKPMTAEMAAKFSLWEVSPMGAETRLLDDADPAATVRTPCRVNEPIKI